MKENRSPLSVRELPQLQRTIIRRLYFEDSRRPRSVRLRDIYEHLNYARYTEAEVAAAVSALVEKGFLLTRREGYYSLSRESFLRARSRYRLLHFLSQSNNLMVIVATSALLATALSAAGVSIFGSRFRFGSTGNRTSVVRDLVGSDGTRPMELRLERVESQLRRLSRPPSGASEDLEVAALKKELEDVKLLTSSLTSSISDDPTKVLDLAAIRSQLEGIKSTQQEFRESIQREVDRISSYNNTIIVFMITFMVAVLGIGVINLLRERKD